MLEPCSHDKAYIAIIITVLPLWAIITTLIVFSLIAFYKHRRPGKLFESGTKHQTTTAAANYLYQIELQSSVPEQLTSIDHTLLILLFLALVFHFSTYDFIDNSFRDSAQAAFKGAILGCCCFSATLVVGIVLRYVVRLHYSLKMGTGPWAVVYNVFCALIFVPSTALWVYTVYASYKYLCSNEFTLWLLSICVAILESAVFALFCTTITWIVQNCSPIYGLPDDVSLIPDDAAPRSASNQPHRSSRQQHLQTQGWQQPASASAALPVQYVIGPPHAYPSQGSAGAGAYPQQQQLPQYIVNPAGTPQAGYKMYQSAGYPAYEQQWSGGPFPPSLTPQQHMVAAHQPVRAHTPPPPAPLLLPTSPMRYHQQTSAKATGKKTGSNESTGSNYYQQLMKKKGGVKSISQYGELLEHKKGAKK